MNDTASILATRDVVNAIVDTLTKAMLDAGISQTAVVRVGLGFRQRIEDGAPFPPALALVDAITKALVDDQRSKIADAVRAAYIAGLSDDGDKFTAPYVFTERLMRDTFPMIERENDGAGEAGGLLNA